MRANPAVEPTRSGLRPPRAAHLKRSAPVNAHICFRRALRAVHFPSAPPPSAHRDQTARQGLGVALAVTQIRSAAFSGQSLPLGSSKKDNVYVDGPPTVVKCIGSQGIELPSTAASPCLAKA